VGATWGLLLLCGFYPIFRAWRATSSSTLRHAVAWAAVAWGVGCLAAFVPQSQALRYLALCLLACTGVAVLGARRPGVGAWNFVVGGLLLALCRPFLEGQGELRLEGAHLFFLAAALAVGLGNYLPTRQAPTAVVLGAWCALELARVEAPWQPLLLAAVPWLALRAERRRSEDGFDAIWRAFRDRYGFVWAQRLRDQFNRSAANAGLGVVLGWTGLRPAPGAAAEPAQLLATLRALLKRFESERP
jgi:hypothetical protein